MRDPAWITMRWSGMSRTEPERIIPATRERLRRAALRAVDDPVKLESAARIIRAALGRKAIKLSELTPPPATPEPSHEERDAA
jgi:hypothetical protein